MNIGVVGLGVIGTAVRDGLAGIGHTLLTHDTKVPGSTLAAVMPSELCFICVPTPQGEGGRCDTSIVESVVRELHGMGYAGAIVIKSTVTPGTTAHLSAELGVVAHLACRLRQCAQEPGQLIQFFDTRHIMDIALDDGVDVLPRPRHTTLG